MLRSLYTAATGMMSERSKLGVITNNITNADTTAYKSDKLVSRAFVDMLIRRIDDPNVLTRSKEVGPLNTGVHIDEIVTDFTQGSIEQTGRASDLAIEGKGYFVVSTPSGNLYTRDGAFTVSAQGYLLSGGHPVMGVGGAVYVGGGAFAIDAAGNVTIDGAYSGAIRVVSFEDEGALRKAGGNLYYNYGNSAVTQGGGSVRQGCLETSNVDIAEQMVRLIEVSNRYETNQRMVRMIDESLGKAVNEVGRV